MTQPVVDSFPYATVADVEAALGRPLDGLDVSTLIESAADLVLAYLNAKTIADPVPGVITRVIAESVANVINRPQTPPDPTDTDYTLGPFAYQVGPSSVGPWLSASQQSRLSLYRPLGAISVGMSSEIIGTDIAPDPAAVWDPYAGTDLASSGNAQDAP
jgi:hypothetical protein